jgi:hypothetical protein
MFAALELSPFETAAGEECIHASLSDFGDSDTDMLLAGLPCNKGDIMVLDRPGSSPWMWESVWLRPGHLSGLSVFHSKSVLYGCAWHFTAHNGGLRRPVAVVDEGVTGLTVRAKDPRARLAMDVKVMHAPPCRFS